MSIVLVLNEIKVTRTMQDNTTIANKTSIVCRVKKVVFHNKENGYSVLSVSADGEDKPFSICGILNGVPKGTKLYCEGEWVEHAKFGRQFQVESWEERKSTQPNEVAAADLARFIAEKTNHNLFLTGKAGTGKTVFLRDFVANTQKKVVVLAPTGIAAINANAMTLHSFCRFGLAPCPQGRVNNGSDFVLNDEEEELVRNIDMIIIDEVSMVRADVMDHISEKIRLIRDSKEPFGGVQLLLIGDLYQLPPVVTKEDETILKDYYGSNYFFFNSEAIRKVGFETVCLSKVYRQNNPEFINILNKAREGDVSWNDCNKLNTRFMAEFEIPKDSRYITLVAQRKQADAINREMIDGVSGDSKSYSAEITGEFPKELYPTDGKLVLKKGAQVMFVKNDKDDKYCNGTLGEIVDMKDDKISVKVGEDTTDVVQASWDNERYVYDKEKKRVIKNTVGIFKQYPLKPAWAITIHKSQGLSFDNAIIDMPRAFAAGQAYVALSRCRTLEGLVLKKKLFPDAFFTDALVSDFYYGVDNAIHIERLAKVLNYKAFEWEDKDDNQSKDKSSVSTDSSQIAKYEDAIGAANTQINAYHETASELDDEFWSIINHIAKTSGLNPYYRLKLHKVIMDDIRDLRSRGLLL